MHTFTQVLTVISKMQEAGFGPNIHFLETAFKAFVDHEDILGGIQILRFSQVSTYLCASVCLSVCMYVCMYVNISKKLHLIKAFVDHEDILGGTQILRFSQVTTYAYVFMCMCLSVSMYACMFTFRRDCI